jgi:Cft2 family RNA processing exonuclease
MYRLQKAVNGHNAEDHSENKFLLSVSVPDEYWSQHPELHDIPIYYASSLAKKCMAVYQTYVNAMNDKIRRQIAINNPFVFRHISNLKVM